MAKLTGILYDDVDFNEYNYEVDEAVVTKNRIAIDWREDGIPFHFVGQSNDGGNTYVGNYGSPQPDKKWNMEISRFTAADGRVLLIARWHQTDNGREGSSAFELADEWE